MSKELIEITHDLSTGAQRQLARLVRKIEDTQSLEKAVGEYLVISTEERFDTQTDPEGNKWQEVKPRTRKRKRHSKILTEDGYLRGDVHPAVTNEGLLVGVGIAYGAIHQLGHEFTQENVTLHLTGTGRNTRFAKKGQGDRTKIVNRTIKVPARPYLGISKADELEILAIANDHLKP
ncbi:virion morphogenesis protein [Geotalea uraniireducens]|uniref:Virion morphogenesis protein n=1 Tax=Geotalea uraniireducens TaxID=351604 RepID=A0ABM8EJ27_9BACT|nr:phage virion morphogenesis protein [Geotalea uraniireducens]BDV42431.1 virion morphogenesis protein [Geotalea uraniireducens]